MKIKMALAKQAVHFLRAMGRQISTVPVMLNKQLNGAAASFLPLVLFHFHGKKKKKSNNWHGLITVHTPSTPINLELFDYNCNYCSDGEADDQLEATTQVEDHGKAMVVPSATATCIGTVSSSSELSRAPSAQEIDKLAEAFIENFYQKMRLERQLSYKRYQEMLARGL